MRVAIVHDWLVVNGGAEKVLKALLELYPQADVYTIVDFLNDKDRAEILGGKKAKSSFIQNLPFAKKYFRNYLPLFPWAIERFDLSSYDLILSSSWAFAKGVKKSPGQLHISYCYTPIRYAWDLYDEYVQGLRQPKRWFVERSLRRIRRWDLQTLERVDYFIADSFFVAERIRRTYRREATVIYPPVELDKFTLDEKKEDFYLTASRLVPYKKTRLIVEAFRRMPEKRLVVIGAGEELEKLKAIATENIDIMGYQEDAVLVKKMQKARAFIYAALEDFGIVPIEAMACGTPVIALGKGGTGETVQEGINGVHFMEQTPEAIVEAVERFEQLNFDHRKVRESVGRFEKDRFLKEMDRFVKSVFEMRVRGEMVPGR